MDTHLEYLVVIFGAMAIAVAMPGLVFLLYLLSVRHGKIAVVEIVPGTYKKSPLARCLAGMDVKWAIIAVVVFTAFSLAVMAFTLSLLTTNNGLPQQTDRPAITARLDKLTQLLDQRLTTSDERKDNVDRLSEAIRHGGKAGLTAGPVEKVQAGSTSSAGFLPGLGVALLVFVGGVVLVAWGWRWFGSMSLVRKGLGLILVATGGAISFGSLFAISMETLVKLDIQFPLDVHLDNTEDHFQINIDKLVHNARAGDAGPSGGVEVVATSIGRDASAFPSGQSRLQNCGVVNALRDDIHDRRGRGQRLLLLVIVGKTDKQPLKPELKRIYGSNLGLGQQRAVFVANCLLTGRSRGDGMSEITAALAQVPRITLAGGPGTVGETLPEEQLRQDRIVVVYALWAIPAPRLEDVRKPAS